MKNFVGVEMGKQFDKSFDDFVQIARLDHADVAGAEPEAGTGNVELDEAGVLKVIA